MKKFLLFIAFCTPLVCASVVNSTEGEAQMVYICTGPQSKVYHRTSKCKGLNKCSGNVKQVTIEKAQSMKRRACRLCY